MNRRFVAIVASILWLGFVAAPRASVRADPAPTPTPYPVPSIPVGTSIDPILRSAIDVLTGAVRQQITNSQNSAVGQVSFFKHFEMQIQTRPNSYRDIHLHQGTVINPRGKSLAVGQTVDVGGVTNSDGSIDANVITIRD